MGPSKVVCQDIKIIFVRHGSSLVPVSANRLIKVKVSFEKEDFAHHPLNFSSEQNDVRKEPEIVEY